MHKTNFSKRGSLKSKRIILASLLPILLFVCFALLFSLICYLSDDPTKNIKIYSLISLLLTAGISGFINSKVNVSLGSFPVLISIFLSSLVILILDLVFGDGISKRSLMNILCYSLVSFLFVFIGKRRSSNRRKIKGRKP